MTILGITNRTENWKTAQKFAPFVRDGNIRLNLVRKLGESSDTQQDDVRIDNVPDARYSDMRRMCRQ